MRFLGGILAFLAHSQLVMAISAVCFVQSVVILLTGHGATAPWLVAAGLSTLGLYLLDSIRSAEREDGLSQPMRSLFFFRHRGWTLVIATSCLGVGALSVFVAKPSSIGWGVLILLGLLSTAYLVPLLPSSKRMVTLKDFGLFKPFVISGAWLVGGLLVAFESAVSQSDLSVVALFGIVVVAGALLLLDSVWLDRRDMAADATFHRPTIAGQLSERQFLVMRIVLFAVAVLGTPWVGVAVGGTFIIGAVGLVLIVPDRLAYESSRVWLAALWRFTGFLGVLLLC